jgi:hypothetical protein
MRASAGLVEHIFFSWPCREVALCWSNVGKGRLEVFCVGMGAVLKAL